MDIGKRLFFFKVFVSDFNYYPHVQMVNENESNNRIKSLLEKVLISFDSLSVRHRNLEFIE